MRRIVLDTETTGLGNARIVEIACIEFHPQSGQTVDVFHSYVNPEDTPVEWGAYRVHGLSNEFLQDKPRFTEVAPGLTRFLQGAEVTAHNAPFDTRMLDREFSLLGAPPLARIAGTINCSLSVARRRLRHLPKHKLDDLCDYYKIDRAIRTSHGALIDCELLVQILLRLEQEPAR